MIETLVVIAIIAILFAVQMPVLSRAIRYARQTEAKESMRQDRIGKMADNANSARPSFRESITRDEARSAFRQSFKTSGGNILATEILYEVRTEAEFRAYWYALIDPDATGDPTFEGGNLVATDPQTGQTFRLAPNEASALQNGKPYPTGWEFLTTRADSMTAASIGINVQYSDSHVEHVRYPGPFPAVRSVAELSQRYVDKLGLRLTD
jgi:hypothetical protein